MKKLVIIASLLFSQICTADDWKKIAENESSNFLINTKTIKMIDIYGEAHIQAWTKVKYESPREFENKKFNELTILYIVNCDKLQFAFKSIIFRLNDAIVSSKKYQDFELDFMPVEPDTNGELFSSEVCQSN